MRRYLMLSLALLISALWMSSHARALILTTEDYPPFNIRGNNDSEVSGISTEIIVEMMKRAGIPITIRVYPWQRALNIALSDTEACVYSTVRTEKREHQYKWVGPVVSDDWALFAMSNSTIVLKTLEDARRYKLGVYQGDAAGDYLVTQKFDVDVVTSDKLNPLKLKVGRIDLWNAGVRTGPFVARREGVENIKPVLIYGDAKDYQMYLACNKSVPDATISQLNEILGKMKKEGATAKIHDKYR